MIRFRLWSWLLWMFIGPVAAGCGEERASAPSSAADSGAADGGGPHAASGDGGLSTRQTLLSTSAPHSCALRKAGHYCWGENFESQLGTGNLVDSDEAVAASVAGTDIVQIAVSTGRSCVRRSTGQIACWGADDVKGWTHARFTARTMQRWIDLPAWRELRVKPPES